MVGRRLSESNAGSNPVAKFRAGLAEADKRAGSLRESLEQFRSTIAGRWTADDRAVLLAHLDRLQSAARAVPQVHRGPKPDRGRQVLEDSVADIIARHGIRPTIAKSGTFALLLEQVHAAVGISQRDVTKAVRRSIGRAKRTAAINQPERTN